MIQAGSYVVIYEYQFNLENIGTPLSFSSAKGDEVYLSQATAPGVLTGWRAYATFDASENGVSFGRHQTSVGVDFTALGARTFGVDNPATTNQFRLGTGLTNAYPKVGPVVLNEIIPPAWHQRHAGIRRAAEHPRLAGAALRPREPGQHLAAPQGR